MAGAGGAQGSPRTSGCRDHPRTSGENLWLVCFVMAPHFLRRWRLRQTRSGSTGTFPSDMNLKSGNAWRPAPAANGGGLRNALRSTDPFVRTSSRTPRAGPRGFRLSALTQRSPPTRFDAMSLLFLQLGHGAQRPDWLAEHLGIEIEMIRTETSEAFLASAARCRFPPHEWATPLETRNT